MKKVTCARGYPQIAYKILEDVYQVYGVPIILTMNLKFKYPISYWRVMYESIGRASMSTYKLNPGTFVAAKRVTSKVFKSKHYKNLMRNRLNYFFKETLPKMVFRW